MGRSRSHEADHTGDRSTGVPVDGSRRLRERRALRLEAIGYPAGIVRADLGLDEPIRGQPLVPDPPSPELTRQPLSEPAPLPGDGLGDRAVPSDETPKPTNQPGSKLITASELLKIEPPTWLIEEFLPVQSLAILYGPPKCGKTFVALDAGLALATGRPCQGHPTEPVDVVYIVGEGLRGFRTRFEAWTHHHSVDVGRVRFWVHREAVNLLNEREVQAFTQRLEEAGVQPGLIVVDTLSRCLPGGDENSAQHMSTAVRHLDGFRNHWPDVTTLILHHTGKNTERGMRGSSALWGAADAGIKVSKSEPGLITVRVDDFKDAEPPDHPVHYELIDGPVAVVTAHRINTDRPSDELLERISSALTDEPDQSGTQLRDHLKIRREKLDEGTRWLQENGYLEITPGDRGAHSHRMIKLFVANSPEGDI